MGSSHLLLKLDVFVHCSVRVRTCVELQPVLGQDCSLWMILRISQVSFGGAELRLKFGDPCVQPLKGHRTVYF